jgi:hypothetical protein
MKKLTLTAAIVLAATAFYAPHATAQVGSAGSTDLVLSFRVTDGQGTGSATDLEVDLGSQSNFTASTALTTPDALLESDLVATYGAGWATRTDLVWSVAGLVSATSGNGANKTFAFDATSSGGAQAEASGTNSTYSAANSNIAGLVGGFNNATAFGIDPDAAQIGNSTTPASSTANSYIAQLSDGGKYDGDYGYFNPGATAPIGMNPAISGSGVTEVNYGVSQSPIGSDELYKYATTKVAGTDGTDLGTFSLNAAGAFTFDGAAVAAPEPSTYALMAGAMGLLFLAVRRRRSNV